MRTDPRSVTRSTSRERGGFVIYEQVDMAGNIVNVALPRALTVDEWAHPVLQHAIGSRRHAPPAPT